MNQLSLLPPEDWPPGFSYLPDFITLAEEAALLEEIRKLELRPYEFQGYTARRTVLSLPVPVPAAFQPFLLRAATALRVPPARISHVLITRYPVGAPIGWHRDAPQFEHLLGISLASECTMQLREMAGKGRNRVSLARRSAYTMKGIARWRWEHHIPPMKEERFSLTFRTLVDDNPVHDSEL